VPADDDVSSEEQYPMNRKSFATGPAAFLAIASAIASACGSSSSAPNPGKGDDGAAAMTDADTTNDSSTAPIGDAGPATCSLLAATCAKGLTCCASLTGSGTCTAPSACTSNFQIECSSAASCESGQVCCSATTGFDASAFDASTFDAAAFDGSFDPGSFDASAFGNVTVKVSCESACGAGTEQLCGSTAECKTPGYTCQAFGFGQSVCAPPPDASADAAK
jgi:hypothetical protein